MPISYVQKMISHAFKFMDLYDNGVQGPLLDYIMRKYRGHRSIPKFVNSELEKLEVEMKCKATKHNN